MSKGMTPFKNPCPEFCPGAGAAGPASILAIFHLKNAPSPQWLYDTPFFSSSHRSFCFYTYSQTHFPPSLHTCCSHNLEGNKGLGFFFLMEI